MEYQGPQILNSSGGKQRGGDLAMFWNPGQGFPACISGKGIEGKSDLFNKSAFPEAERRCFLSSGSLAAALVQITEVLYEWGMTSVLFWRSYKWQRKWMTQGREPGVQRDTLPFLQHSITDATNRMRASPRDRRHLVQSLMKKRSQVHQRTICHSDI